MRVSMPWDHPQPAPEGQGVRNEPTAEGRELGAGLARFAADEAARQPDLPPMCLECAFRPGTDANGSAPTLMSALKCLMEGTPFWCHGGRARVPCSGFMALARAEKEGGPDDRG